MSTNLSRRDGEAVPWLRGSLFGRKRERLRGGRGTAIYERHCRRYLINMPLWELSLLLIGSLPWFNHEIKDAIKARRRVERKWRYSKSAKDLSVFKKKKNHAIYLMNQARSDYYTNHIQQNSSDQRKLCYKVPVVWHWHPDWHQHCIVSTCWHCSAWQWFWKFLCTDDWKYKRVFG